MPLPSDGVISEGLKRHALQDLVLPLLSIDEYESKISDKRAIVVGIYVLDEDPAIDLSNFIDRGSSPLLDTEVSPAPTPEGHFMVFVEMARNDSFPTALVDLLREIENICDVPKWSFTCPDCTGPTALNEENLRAHIVLDASAVHDNTGQEAEEPTDKIAEMAEFWKDAAVDAVEHQDDDIVLHTGNVPFRLRRMPEGTYLGSLDPDNSDARLLESMLGGHPYEVWATDDALLITKGDSTMLVQKLP